MSRASQALARAIHAWFDASAIRYGDGAAGLDWPRLLPFIGLHLGCFAVFWVGVSTTALAVALVLYVVRMFAITGFYHRYLAHKAYRTSRLVQLGLALVAASAAQRGPLWWVSHHRHHHAHADDVGDAHSPVHHGFWHAHAGWFLYRRNFATRMSLVKDLARFPELRFLDRYDTLAPALLAVALHVFGEWLATAHPDLGTSGPQLLVWGFFVSTVVLHHATFTVNSLAHRYGRRRYATRDQSRNSFWLALLTLGEGWHNNHHHYPGSARQGFYWWEIDLTFYGLRLLEMLGLIRDLRTVPPAVREARHAQ